MFVLHGNVYDVVLHRGQTLSLTEFLTGVLLKESRETIVAYNVSTGARFAKRAADVAVLEELLLSPQKDRALAALESVLATSSKAAVIIEYAETIAPAGDPNFQADADRASIVTLHRWSSLPEIERRDNVVLLVTENLSELSPKLVSNPKVAVVEVPMPDAETRAAAASARQPEARRARRAPLRGDHRRAEGRADHLDPRAAARCRGGDARARGVHQTDARRGAGRGRAGAQTRAAHERHEPRGDQEADRAGRRPGRRRGGGGRGRAGAGARRGRPPDRAPQARDPRARVLRPRRVRRAEPRLRRGGRDGRGQEGSAPHRREHPRGAHEPRPDGHPLHRPDGHGQDLRRRGVRARSAG